MEWDRGTAKAAIDGTYLASGPVVFAAAWFFFHPAHPSSLVFAVVGWLIGLLLIQAFFILVVTPSEQLMRLLCSVALSVVFGALTAVLVYPFSPVLATTLPLVLAIVGLLVGTVITFAGASFIMGLGVYSLLMMGLGHSLGELYGATGAWVAGLFALSLLTGMFLPPLRTFQRALLSSLITVAAGAAGGMLGAALGAPLPWALWFLSTGLFLSMLISEERAMALAFHSVLASLMMGIGYTAAYFAGGTAAWVSGSFCLSVAGSVFAPPSRARLLMLLLVPVDLFVAVGYLVGGSFSGAAPYAIIFMFALAVLFDIVFYFASDSRVLGMNDAWVVTELESPRAHQLARKLASAAGLPPPRLAVISSETPNLFTVGRKPSRAVIAMTRGLLEVLSDEELEAVLAHEMAHIRERDLLPMTMAAAIASLVGGAARALRSDRERTSDPLMLFTVGLLAPFFALLVQLSNPRAREKRADAVAVRMTHNNEALARALEKLEDGAVRNPLGANPATGPLFAVNPFRGGWLAALFATHPPTGERVDLVRRRPASPAGG